MLFNVTASVSRCTFEGDCSFLVLEDPEEYLRYLPNNPDQVFEVHLEANRFLGPNTGILGSPEQIMGV